MGLPQPPFSGDLFGPDAVIMKDITGANWCLRDYEARGGYQALRKILAENIAPEQVIPEPKRAKAEVIEPEPELEPVPANPGSGNGVLFDDAETVEVDPEAPF